MASTKVATIEKARPPAWDLLTTPQSRTPRRNIIGILWLLDSIIWLRHPRKMEKVEKKDQRNREHSSKVPASKDLHYICMGICVKGQYRWTELQNARIRGG